MLLENPALKLTIGVQDILEILQSTLKQKNWTNFDVANLKLLYTPFYLFNYDTLVEGEVEGRSFSQGFSGLMAINAVTGELEPILSDSLEKHPFEFEKELSHDLQFELEPVAITKEEIKDTCRIKLAGQFNLRKDDMSVSGFRLVYWPIWRIFVQMPSGGTQRIDVDAVMGNPLNYEHVPTREKTWLEVTNETLAKMKTAKGLVEISRKAVQVAASGSKKAASAAQSEQTTSGLSWLFTSKIGLYTVLLVVVIILLLFFFNK